MKHSIRKNILYSSVYLGTVLILLFPRESRADAITPILNLFAPQTVVPASILTALIILVEAILLWKWTKPITFRLSLWRSALTNIVSSGAGSIAAWLFFQKQMIWEMTELYVPMFFLTLATETPALKYLYRQNGFGWKRVSKVSFFINVISYLFAFIAQFGFVFGYLGYADFVDQQTIKKWNDLSLLEGETGYIYTVKYDPAEGFRKYVFNRYDVENKKWETVDPGFERGIYPRVWDVNANLIACEIDAGDWNNRSVSLIDAATFSRLSKVDGDFREVQISPGLSKLAVLEYVRDLNAPRDDESGFMLGSGCKLKIYDINSGSLINEAPRLAIDAGLAWISNSSIVFSSLRDESLLANFGVETHGRSYGRSYAKEGQFPIDLFIYHSATDSVQPLVEGQRPQFIEASNAIAFIRESGFHGRELWQVEIGQKEPRLILSDIHGRETAASPSGRRYLISIPHKQPFGGFHFLTIFDPDAQGRKLILDPEFHYGFRWTEKK